MGYDGKSPRLLLRGRLAEYEAISIMPDRLSSNFLPPSSMSSVQLAKRKRSDPTELTKKVFGIENIKRSQNLWFHDGSIILQAQKTQFRVHRSVLCNYSKVFQDMFTVPQQEVSAVVDGAPLIHVIDKAIDWENVLGVIYFGLK